MNAPTKEKTYANLKSISKIALVSLTLALVGGMIFQCTNLCIDFYNQPVTTSVQMAEVDQIAFLPKLQFCFIHSNMMNITRAHLMGLNDVHRYYLQTFFISLNHLNRTRMVPVGLFDNFGNETKFEIYMYRLFDAWNEIESEVIRIAEIAINSSNPMEFWDFSKKNNIVPMRLSNGTIIASGAGPYTSPSSWDVCYDIPSAASDQKDAVQFDFKFSVNREFAIGMGFAYISPYVGDAIVFDDDEFIMLDYAKDHTKYLTLSRNSYAVRIKKWSMLNIRNRSCIEDEELLVMQ